MQPSSRRQPLGLVAALICASGLVAALAGCTPLQVTSAPLLNEARLSQNSVVLDLFFVRLPHNQSDADLWRELDEQIASPPVRRALFAQGFRVGKSAVQPPAQLAKLLNAMPDTTPDEEGVVTQLEFEPIVTRRHLQLPSGQRTHIEASRNYPTMSLLELTQRGEVSGSTLKQAQCLFVAWASTELDGRVKLNLLPEIHHGDVKSEYVPIGPGRFRLDSQRQRKTFDPMTLETPLSPGEMLVIGGQPDRAGTASHYFFSEKTSTGTVRKLLVIRVSQTQHDAALAPIYNSAAESSTVETASSTP